MWLIKWEEDWADEFYIFGIEVITSNYRNNLIERLKKAIDFGSDVWEEYYFGTNEWMDFSFSCILKKLESAKELSEMESLVLAELGLENQGQIFLDMVNEKLIEYGFE